MNEIIRTAETVLKRNVFKFGSDRYVQVHLTSVTALFGLGFRIKRMHHSSIHMADVGDRTVKYVHRWNAVSVVSTSTGREHKVRCGEDANCKATMVVYCLTCSVCGMQYVGQTENLRKRLNNRKSCIRVD